MEIFIALLRGINVSGQKKIKMSDLKTLFEDLSFTNVRTYIQSGNVLFTSKSNNKKIIRFEIEKKILKSYGYQVQLILKTPDELKFIIKNNPFLKNKNKVSERMYFAFLSEIPSSECRNSLQKSDFSPEEFSLNGDVIYLFLPNGAGEAKLNNNFFEKKLNVYATTRNYKTIETLSALTVN